MASVTLSRGSQSVSIPLVEEGGTPLFISDWGKPQLNVRESGGTLNPRTIDQFSGNLNFNVVGRLFDYQTSHELADLIKTCDPDNPLELSIPFGEYDDTVIVAPSAGQEAALTLTYQAGYKDNVTVELSLTRVNQTLGSITQQATTPTTTGTGPVQIETNSTTVPIETDLTITRSVGRPNDVVRRSPGDYPYHIQKPKVAFDEFGLEFQSFESAVSDMKDITEPIFEERLGRNGITLNFNGIFGLGAFDVVPTGSAPFRQTRAAGEEGYIRVPTFDVRRITAP
jgi:hypothetical protein